VYGATTNGVGVYGISTNGIGVYGVVSNTASAVKGANTYTGTCTGSVSECAGLVGTSTNGPGIYASSTNDYAGYFAGPVVINGALTVNSCTGCSDIRLKKNVKPLANAIDRLLSLKGVTFEWIDPSLHENEAGHGAGTQIGFIAQDVEKTFPGWVKEDGYVAKDGTKYRTLELRQIEALEVESIRMLKLQNDVLMERVHDLESGVRPRVSGIDLNGVGFGVGGLAIAGAIVFTRRRRAEESKPG
jgi:hypothetical protein